VSLSYITRYTATLPPLLSKSGSKKEKDIGIKCKGINKLDREKERKKERKKERMNECEDV
jgi:hypothetical protein